eukprot:Gb_34633 [translate_table: standard]
MRLKGPLGLSSPRSFNSKAMQFGASARSPTSKAPMKGKLSKQNRTCPRPSIAQSPYDNRTMKQLPWLALQKKKRDLSRMDTDPSYNCHSNGIDINFSNASYSAGLSPASTGMQTAAQRFYKAQETFKKYAALEDQPTRTEIISWHIYGLCSHFVQAVLIPLLFPLLLSHTVHLSADFHKDRTAIKFPKPRNHTTCSQPTLEQYERLVQSTLSFGDVSVSPVLWVSTAWAITMALMALILPSVSPLIDYGKAQKIVLAISAGVGALACLPTGLFRNVWPVTGFLLVAIVGSSISSMVHNRHLALMIRGASTPMHRNAVLSSHKHFAKRQTVGNRMSLHGTALGGVGAAAVAAFAYKTLNYNNKRLGIWIACIFGGIKWAIGIGQAFAWLFVRNGPEYPDEKFSILQGWTNAFTIRKFPHAITSLATLFVASSTSSCIFVASLLHALGALCFKPEYILWMWLAYFVAPVVCLPVMHPVHWFLKVDGRQMQTLGFVVTAAVSAIGYLLHNRLWAPLWTIVGAAVQGLSVGMLNSYCRTLFLDFTPPGKEGAFLAWFTLVKGAGLCAGFGVASWRPDIIRISFGSSFCAACVGILLLLFGNVGNYRGVVLAGHVKESPSKSKTKPASPEGSSSPVQGLDLRPDSRRKPTAPTFEAPSPVPRIVFVQMMLFVFGFPNREGMDVH